MESLVGGGKDRSFHLKFGEKNLNKVCGGLLECNALLLFDAASDRKLGRGEATKNKETIALS